MKYLYQRIDTGEIIEIDDFDTVMNQKDGHITLKDGVSAKRRVDLEEFRDKRKVSPSVLPHQAELLSTMALGCTAAQVKYYRKMAEIGGFTGVEFVPDKNFEFTRWYDCKLAGPAEREDYINYRQLVDNNSRNGGGVAITPQQFIDASAAVVAKYGPPLVHKDEEIVVQA